MCKENHKRGPCFCILVYFARILHCNYWWQAVNVQRTECPKFLFQSQFCQFGITVQPIGLCLFIWHGFSPWLINARISIFVIQLLKKYYDMSIRCTIHCSRIKRLFGLLLPFTTHSCAYQICLYVYWAKFHLKNFLSPFSIERLYKSLKWL